ncbi:cytidine deaminase [Clostridium acetobutylicum]|uniref:Cytidine deaminase n=1 Tax=Clostridium acetobutylicum (strain ATCC 824 / DSM 792 / JCM 1419 / IAM 19013 / LMG 5710 / NBRC 13948 / NRRL B-527 / VKM B-1787 / 2291 / W) TaxID=272562 RepID=Q97IU6_CLOAB|nr:MULTISPECIES: cytidine deaminase [Clostridium]AAK79511.1 Cytidine deaminase, cdd [Clostridium acetobutylicum ATCC 824]ADZ20596.1 cytidine deaminase [Clostridium acetobutylicum EA 2018]AEI33703.1 cytidine deaminase [Clostridium acetobutylicum DSM 1731]AWV81244.1 cytidine deaminase [Clostridium acetobutylicum]KHD36284.1 cytidine deaminase [Clostridium acetobutylicum]
MDYSELVYKALEARKKAYAPYSKFKVGAAVIADNGEIYTGCNIENASYGATNCAERTAIFKAVSEGHTKLNAIAIVGVEKDYTYPCGICRQVIAEFASEDMKIVLGKNSGEYIVKTLEEILPGAFTKEDLKK